MNKNLVIVESPAKAKTINKYLGNDYIVKSSIGHVRDLPNSSFFKKHTYSFNRGIQNSQKDERISLINRMGINPWNNWEANYKIIPSKEKVVYDLRKIAEKVNYIYLATDLDREGEAIAWHLQEVLGGEKKRYNRIIFNEITKQAIHQAFKKPYKLNIDRVNAQQARRFMDRIVGYMVSPLLWERIAHGLSAGRVQSVAVRLVVDREREIKSFLPKKYWEIHANVITPFGKLLSLQVTDQENKIFQSENWDQTEKALAFLEKAHYQVFNKENKVIVVKPSAPFITTTLQQAASIHLNFNIKKTMMIAQYLYESGYITYMRTDSTNLSQNSIDIVRSYISENFSKEYLPECFNSYKDKKASQEAHEAIRPSDVTITPEKLENIEEDIQKLYRLIWCQFVACQMTSARYNSTKLTVNAGNFSLKAYGRTLLFDGWKKIISTSHNNEKDNLLPIVNIGDKLSLIKISPVQKFTKFPARFSEASLIKELEKCGIGRPSTYASIITTMQNRGYIKIKNNRLYAEKIGEIVTDCLEESFPKLMNYNFTAQMEIDLDRIAKREIKWKKVLDHFFVDFIFQLNNAKKDPKEGGMKFNKMILTNISCNICGCKMGIHTTTTGIFLGCSSYILSNKKKYCKNVISLVSEKKILNSLEYDNTKSKVVPYTRYRCKKCNTAMDGYLINTNQKLYICGNSPNCNEFKIAEEESSINIQNLFIIKCEKCASEMHQKIGKFGNYMACINNQCKNTRKIFQNGR